MENYVKIYQRILHSSIWKLPSDYRIVWITLLALKDENGCVFGTPEWLADQAIVPDEFCFEALKAFIAPDKRSRTPANDGRKIEAIDGGWRILNHLLYRDGLELQRDKWKRQKAAQRENKTSKPKIVPLARELTDSGDVEDEGGGGLKGKAKDAALESLNGFNGNTEELTAELSRIHGPNGEIGVPGEPEQWRIDKVNAKIALAEAREDEVRKQFNPNYDPSKSPAKIVLKPGETINGYLKAQADSDPTTIADKKAVRKLKAEGK